jgi:hypothetical protein
MPEDMALAKAFCAALEDEHIGISQADIDFKKGIGGHFTMFIAAQLAKDHLDYSGNLSLVAAIAVLANNVRNEPDTIDENACLLQYPTEGVDNKFLVIVDDLLKAEECYLHYDKIEHEWQRSGKVSDRVFGDQHKDHWKNAENSG